jgi:hypothetical protein
MANECTAVFQAGVNTLKKKYPGLSGGAWVVRKKRRRG